MITASTSTTYTIGTGAKGPYAITFDFDDISEIAGYYRTSADAAVALVAESVSATDKTVTFTTTVPSGRVLVIYRATDKVQPIEFNRRGNFEAAKHDDAMDRTYKMLQEDAEQAYRSLRINQTQARFDVTLPYDLSDDAGSVLQLNETGTGITLLPDAQLLADAGSAATEAELSAANAEVSAGQTIITAAQAVTRQGIAESNRDDVLELVADRTDIEIVDLGTAGGTATPGHTYLVDTSLGTVAVTVEAGPYDDGVLTIKSASPYVGEISISVPGNGLEGYSTLSLMHPFQSVTLANSGDDWYAIGEHNDVPLINHPILEYVDSSVISVRAKYGSYPLLSALMQDGRVYHHDGASISVDLSESGALGLDTGSVAADTWYYLYLVPSGSAWRELTAIASASPPATGPSGHSLFSYCGAVRTKEGSTNIRPWVQMGNKFYIYDLEDYYGLLEVSGQGTETLIWQEASPATQSARAYVALARAIDAPVTYSEIMIAGRYGSTDVIDAKIQLSTSLNGSTPTWPSETNLNWSSHGALEGISERDDLTAHRRWYAASATDYIYWSVRGTGNNIFASICGWADGWLPA